MTNTPATRNAVVTSTPLVTLSGERAYDLATYLEEHDLAKTLLEHRVADAKILKNPAGDGFFLDLAQLSSVAPSTLIWLKRCRCQLVSGCRIELCEESALEDLLMDYQGDIWQEFGYALIAASAVEISVALELREHPCLLQLELLGASYLDIPVSPWKRPVYPHK